MLGLSVQIDGQRVPTQTRDDLQTLADFISSYLRITGTMERNTDVKERIYPLRNVAPTAKPAKTAATDDSHPAPTHTTSDPQVETPQPELPGIQSPGLHRRKELSKPTSPRTSEWVVYAARSAQRPATASDLYHIAVADGFKSKAVSPVNAFRTTVSSLTKHGLLRLAGHNEEGILVYVVSNVEG